MNTVEVNLAGTIFRLNSTENADFMKRAAQVVNQEIQKFQDSGASTLDAALLTALSFAENLQKAYELPKSKTGKKTNTDS